MPVDRIENYGLVVSLDEFRPTLGFPSTGYYWKGQARDIILQSFGAFLPPVDISGAESKHRVGFVGGSSRHRDLWKSKILGNRRISPRLARQLFDEFAAIERRSVDTSTQPQAIAVIRSFMLPDPAKNPEQYRISGPIWRRRLHILWGCEQNPGTSLPPKVALEKLPIDRLAFVKLTVSCLAIVIVVCGLLWASKGMMRREWATIRREYLLHVTDPPVAVLGELSVDPKHRTIVIGRDDSFVRDKRIGIRSWRIDWGEQVGSEELLMTPPEGRSHHYSRDGEFHIRLGCVDNLGRVAYSPETVKHIDYVTGLERRAKTLEDVAGTDRNAAEIASSEERAAADRVSRAEEAVAQTTIDANARQSDAVQAPIGVTRAKERAENSVREAATASDALKHRGSGRRTERARLIPSRKLSH